MKRLHQQQYAHNIKMPSEFSFSVVNDAQLTGTVLQTVSVCTPDAINLRFLSNGNIGGCDFQTTGAYNIHTSPRVCIK